MLVVKYIHNIAIARTFSIKMCICTLFFKSLLPLECNRCSVTCCISSVFVGIIMQVETTQTYKDEFLQTKMVLLSQICIILIIDNLTLVHKHTESNMKHV